DLAADLQCFIDDEPIKAREISVIERTWRWCKRYPMVASLLAAVILVFFAGFAGVIWQWREAQQTRNAAALQAAALLLDKGIEFARGGEPARALHLFVKALQTLPAGDQGSIPLERVIRANFTAWAETVPTLEQIWPGGVKAEEAALSPDGELIALVV